MGPLSVKPRIQQKYSTRMDVVQTRSADGPVKDLPDRAGDTTVGGP